jgi:hypothetical protein
MVSWEGCLPQVVSGHARTMDDIAIGANCRVMQEEWLEAAASLSYRFTNNNKNKNNNNRIKNNNANFRNTQRQPVRTIRRVQAPVAKGMVGGRAQAQFNTLPNGSIRVRHREFVTNIDTNSTAQNMVALPLNPGDGKTFPWLSLMANNYDRWEPVRMSVSYEPFVATTVSGTVSAFIDYDPTDAAPTNKAAMLNSMGAKRSPVWSNFAINMARSEIKHDKHLFTRVPAREVFDGNLRLTDAGTIFVAVTDSNHVGDIGEIWIDYEILLHVPAFHKDDPNASRRLIFNATEQNPLGASNTADSERGSAVDYTTAADPDPAFGTIVKFAQDFVGQLEIDMPANALAKAPSITYDTSENGIANGTPLLGDAFEYTDTASLDTYHAIEVVAKAGDAFRVVADAGSTSWSGADVLMKCLPYAKSLMGVLLAVSTTQEKFAMAIKQASRPSSKRLSKQDLLEAARILSSTPTGTFTIPIILALFAASPLQQKVEAKNFYMDRLVRICNSINY